MRAIFLADAHLFQPGDSNYQRLNSFLDRQIGQLDRLYLLGDIFEFWLGYRYSVFSTYLPILETLRHLQQSGCQLIFVEGNHDFHLGPYMTETLKAEVYPDDCSAELGDLRLHLCHGDLINTADNSYHRLRAVLRSRLTRLISRLTPTDFAWGVYAFLRRRSQARRSCSTSRRDPLPLVRAYAEQQIAAGHQLVICGHFHTPVDLKLEGGRLIILGDWIEQFSYLLYQDGQFSLKSAPPET